MSNRKWLEQDFRYFNDLRNQKREQHFSLVFCGVSAANDSYSKSSPTASIYPAQLLGHSAVAFVAL